MNRITQYFPVDDLFGDDLDEAAVFAFDGRDLDPGEELQNHFMRHCDPTPGRWIDKSPVGCEARDENVRPYCPSPSRSDKGN